MSLSNLHIEYLTRSYLDLVKGEPSDITVDLPGDVRVAFIKVTSISRVRERKEKLVSSNRELMQDVILGLKGMRVPLLFLLIGEKHSVSIFVGTYIDQKNEDKLRPVIDSLASVFISAYPGIEFEKENRSDVSEPALRIFRAAEIKEKTGKLVYSAIETGIPTSKVEEDKSEVEQIDRLIRGLYGQEWAYTQVAIPVSQEDVTRTYSQVLMEFKNIIDNEARTKVKNPINERYQELLKKYVKKLEDSKAQGAWRVCSYLSCSDPTILDQGCGIMESVFGGKESLIDPIRTIKSSRVTAAANSFAQISTQAPRGPGNIQYGYKYMRMMSSPDLATIIHLPTLEMPGFWVKNYTRFDVYSQKKNAPSIEIGEILDEAKRMGSQYQVGMKDLNKHCLVVGTTGSGKTNTVFYMMKQLWSLGIPFLVIEPAKTEYRKLINSQDMGPDLQVFTLGEEDISHFRLNPFEILPGVSLQTHIDHLKSVFGASFPMWAPMPQVLEKAIHEIYEDKGWQLVEGVNTRGESINSFPTLTDLYSKIDDIVRDLGYEERVTMDVQAALKTRLDSLRIGGKGLMLDVRKGVPFDLLMKKPTIIELDAIADDDEKALLMGLLLVFLQEHYQSMGLKEDIPLRHVTVVEEAHRLLSNVGRGLDSEVANTRWKAVETFANMLSELRAYGEGFIIAEQIPTKLAPDVIKNSNTKIMHRIVSEEDRKVVGGSMNLDERESRKATSLSVGQALVFGEGDDSAFQIKVPYAKIKSNEAGESDRNLVVNHMRGFLEHIPEVYTPFDNCFNYCESICSYRIIGRKMIDDPGFRENMSRFVLTTVENPSFYFQGYKELKTRSRDTWQGVLDSLGVLRCIFIQASHRYFEEMGANYKWSYIDSSKLKSSFMEILNTTLSNDEEIINFSSQQNNYLKVLASEMEEFNNNYREATLKRQPYDDLCLKICRDGTCLYRFGVKELLVNTEFVQRLVKVVNESPAENMAESVLKEVVKASKRVVSSDGNLVSETRAGLCCCLHTAIEIWPNEYYEVERFMENILENQENENEVAV